MNENTESETVVSPEQLFVNRANLIAYLEYAVSDAAVFGATSATLLIMAIDYLDNSPSRPPLQNIIHNSHRLAGNQSLCYLSAQFSCGVRRCLRENQIRLMLP